MRNLESHRPGGRRSSRPVLLACLALLAACGKQAPKQDAKAAKKNELVKRTVRAVPVQTGERVDSVEVIGELQGIEEIRVFAQVPERIRTLAVKEGDLVRQGDLIATILSDLQGEAVRQTEAGLEAALANRDAINDNLKRTRALVEGGGGTRGQLESFEAQARAAEAQVRQATAAVASASAQQNRTIIRSPTTGVVAQLNVKVGDMASPAMPIATIVRDERVKAVLRVPERDFLRVKAGMPVRIAPLATPEAYVDAKVTLKGPVVDRLTRTGLVEVALDNKDKKLLAGSAIRATIELERRAGVVLVPAEAIILGGETEKTGRAVAFVVNGEKAVQRDVQLGTRQGSQLEILSGLTAGEQLVVDGAQFLRDQNPIVLAQGAEKSEKAGKEATP